MIWDTSPRYTDLYPLPVRQASALPSASSKMCIRDRDGAQATGESQPFFLIDRDLQHAGELVLDRILDGDDVVSSRPIHMVDHRREGGGLSRPGRSSHEHQPRSQVAEVDTRLREPELVDRRHVEPVSYTHLDVYKRQDVREALSGG